MDGADALLSQSVLKPGFQKNYKVPVNDKNGKIEKRIKKVLMRLFIKTVSLFNYVGNLID